ncbi:hypothetical protein ACFL4C_01080 [Candidatus Omnitrophota bacterium]
MKNRQIRRCQKCGLPQAYPGIKFNKDNICNYCIYYFLYKDREELIKSELKSKFIKLIKDTQKKKNKYDCIVAYSGGKDSTFLLSYLKSRFRLKILAHTLDNGFMSKRAMKNIKIISSTLNIDYRITRPDYKLLKDIFSYALARRIPYPKEILSMMSQVCAVCIGMVFGTTINTAIKLNIPLMFIGFTPGQYPAISLENFLKVKSCMFLSHKVYRDDPLDVIKIIADPVLEQFGLRSEKYFFRSQYLPEGLSAPKVLFPFHALLKYDERAIIAKISQLGWIKPKELDSCSTNCLLNSAGNYACLKQLGYHPYAGELGYLVREGKISRERAINDQGIDENSFAIRHSLRKLNITKKQILNSK